jgi:hypothetical protein
MTISSGVVECTRMASSLVDSRTVARERARQRAARVRPIQCEVEESVSSADGQRQSESRSVWSARTPQALRATIEEALLELVLYIDEESITYASLGPN